MINGYFVSRFIRTALAVAAIGPASLLVTVPALSAQQPITIRIGHNTPVNTPLDAGIKRFGKLVEERSGGKIMVKDYPAGQIGNEQQMIEGMQVGTLEMAGIIGSTY